MPRELRAVTVRAATDGGVTFDGGSVLNSTGMTFAASAHDQTWDGFHFANMRPVSTGIVVFGGQPDLAPPRNITMTHITVDATCHRSATLSNQEHAFYFAAALSRGPHDILLQDIVVDGSDTLGIWSAIHMDHGDSAAPAGDHVTVRRLTVTGTYQAIILWSPPTHDWLIDTATITGAHQFAIRFESVGASNIVFKDIVSTGSIQGPGFYSSMGANPVGVSFINDSLR